MHYYISIHAPRAGRDDDAILVLRCVFGFQSTRPVRGATFLISVELIISSHFNPRAPCGARLGILGNYDPVIVISIHAPRAGRAYIIGYKFPIDFRFQSTRPVRGATGNSG